MKYCTSPAGASTPARAANNVSHHQSEYVRAFYLLLHLAGAEFLLKTIIRYFVFGKVALITSPKSVIVTGAPVSNPIKNKYFLVLSKGLGVTH